MTVEICAEWGQSHAGSRNTALLQVEATAQAGANIAKFQVFDPKRLASKTARRYWSPSLGGSESQLATFTDNGMLTTDDWIKVAEACRKAHVEFCATPFDLEAVDLLAALGVETIKLASGDLTYPHLIHRAACHAQRLLLSTGASTLAEIDRALEWCYDANPNCQVTVLACELSYPAQDANLDKIRQLRQHGQQHVGYSDHTLQIGTAAAAVRAGATILEKHCTLDPDGGVPDDKMALDPTELKLYVETARAAVPDEAQPMVAAEMVTAAEHAARVGARRSIHAATTMGKGHTVTPRDLCYLRPCPDGALEPWQDDSLIDAQITRRVTAGEALTADHFA